MYAYTTCSVYFEYVHIKARNKHQYYSLYFYNWSHRHSWYLLLFSLMIRVHIFYSLSMQCSWSKSCMMERIKPSLQKGLGHEQYWYWMCCFPSTFITGHRMANRQPKRCPMFQTYSSLPPLLFDAQNQSITPASKY